MIRLYILLILILTANTIAFAQAQTDTTANEIDLPSEWKTLEGDKFEIKYPPNWTVDKSGLMGSSFILFSELSDETDNFKENVNLLIQDLGAYELTLDQYVEISENQIKTLITNGKIISSERMKDGEAEYQKVIYTGKQGIYDLQFEQYYMLIAKKAFVLTFTSEESQFNNYRKVGEKILNSFKIKKRSQSKNASKRI